VPRAAAATCGAALVRAGAGRAAVDGWAAGVGRTVGVGRTDELALEWTATGRIVVEVAAGATVVRAAVVGVDVDVVGRSVRVGSGAKVTCADGATGMLKAAAGSVRGADALFMCRATTAPPATAADAARPPTTRPTVMGSVCQM